MAITAPRRVRAYLIHVERVLTFLTFDRFLRLEPRSRGASFLKAKHTPFPPSTAVFRSARPGGRDLRDMSNSFHGCLWSRSTQAQSGSCKSDKIGCSASGRRTLPLLNRPERGPGGNRATPRAARPAAPAPRAATPPPRRREGR